MTIDAHTPRTLYTKNDEALNSAYVTEKFFHNLKAHPLTADNLLNRLKESREIIRHLETLAKYGKGGQAHKEHLDFLEKIDNNIFEIACNTDTNIPDAESVLNSLYLEAENIRKERITQVEFREKAKFAYKAGMIGAGIGGAITYGFTSAAGDNHQDTPETPTTKTAPAAETSARHPILDQFGIS